MFEKEEEFNKPCDKDCVIHKLKTHNACLFCESIRNSPYHGNDVSGMSDNDIRQMQSELEKEMD